jgi:predicted nucleic acid-binding protein
MAGVNIAEFYYKSCQKVGKQAADTWYFQVLESGLAVVASEELDRLAGLEKCRHPSLALADCYALALAKAEAALLLTTDGDLANVPDVSTKRFTKRPQS